MKLFTIGFTQTSAEHFFRRLGKSGARRLVDVRLRNSSQLAGFAKQDDLRFFTERLCGIEYQHAPDLAPTPEMLSDYRGSHDGWDAYAERFLGLMRDRHIEARERANLDGACLLCSEDTAHHCHRRLVAEYLRDRWGDVEIEHL